MIGIRQLRSMFPQYRDRSDEELARAYHAKLYAKMDYGEFQRQFAAADGRFQSGGRRSQAGSGGKRQEGVSPERKAMARIGYGYDRETGLYYPFRLDEEGKRDLDYSARPASDEMVEEVRNRAAGFRPFQQKQASPPVQARTPAPEQAADEEFDRGWNIGTPKQDTPKQDTTWRDAFYRQQASRSGAASAAQAAPGPEFEGVDMGPDNLPPELVNGAARGMALIGDGARGVFNYLRGARQAGDR